MSKSILVVEDEKPLLGVIKSKFEEDGYEVVSARMVAQAFDYLNEGVKIDAIWLDHYLLGNENGLDFVARIKQDNNPWKNVPVFVVSNTASPENVQSYLHFGVDRYYTKVEYKLSQIIEDVEKALEEKS